MTTRSNCAKPPWNARPKATGRICRGCKRDIPEDEGHFSVDTDFELEAPVCFPCVRDRVQLSPPEVP